MFELNFKEFLFNEITSHANQRVAERLTISLTTANIPNKANIITTIKQRMAIAEDIYQVVEVPARSFAVELFRFPFVIEEGKTFIHDLMKLPRISTVSAGNAWIGIIRPNNRITCDECNGERIINYKNCRKCGGQGTMAQQSDLVTGMFRFHKAEEMEVPEQYINVAEKYKANCSRYNKPFTPAALGVDEVVTEQQFLTDCTQLEKNGLPRRINLIIQKGKNKLLKRKLNFTGQ